jgi:hypothetical protein
MIIPNVYIYNYIYIWKNKKCSNPPTRLSWGFWGKPSDPEFP